MTELKLALCPFCGGEASKRLFHKGRYRVHCNVCDAHSGDVCDTEAEAVAAWNARATLGSGTLTAEQVSRAAYEHSIHADCADADWQAIADELNATLGGGECVITPIAPGSDMGRCSACEQVADVHSNYCWKCGAKAVKR